MSNEHGNTRLASIPKSVVWLQGVTIAWMSIETALSLCSAQQVDLHRNLRVVPCCECASRSMGLCKVFALQNGVSMRC